MLSIVIPIFFNKLELYQVIDNCINSVKEFYPDEELILIDDCSPLPCDDWPITYRKDTNTGFTQTVNEGLKRATSDKIVIMNDDIILQKGDLDKFYTMEEGIYSPKTTDEGEGDRFGSIWGMNRQTFEKMGYLDINYPHYFSDTEYYNRAKTLNISIVKWANIVVDHIGKATYKGMEHDRDLDRNLARGL